MVRLSTKKGVGKMDITQRTKYMDLLQRWSRKYHKKWFSDIWSRPMEAETHYQRALRLCDFWANKYSTENIFGVPIKLLNKLGDK